MSKRKKLIVIGRSDKIDLPELELYDIAAKIDSGAFTSTIHCHNIREIKTKTETTITFNLLDPSHSDYNEKEFILKNYTKKTVKSSTGHVEDRYIIQTTAQLFNKNYPIELSLSDRKDMKFPILIGRKLLINHFVIDVAKNNLSFKLKTGKIKKLKVYSR